MTDDLLHAILAELRAIRAALEVRPGDPHALLAVIRASWGREFFTGSELLLFAHRPGASALRLALRAAGVADSARSLGKLLASIEGDDAGGMTVQRMSAAARTGILWKVCEFDASLRVVTRNGAGHAEG